MHNKEWANNCEIISAHNQGGYGDSIVKCQNVDKPFLLFNSTGIFPPKGSKDKIVIGVLDPTKLQIIQNAEDKKPQLVFFPKPEDEPHIKEGVEVVVKVFDDAEGPNRNKIIINIYGLLVEEIDQNEIKAKVGDFVKVGQIHYCWSIYPSD